MKEAHLYDRSVDQASIKLSLEQMSHIININRNRNIYIYNVYIYMICL